MRPWVLFTTLGAIAVLAPVTAYLYHRSAHARDVEGVAALRAALDSVQAELDAAATASDSARLAPIVRGRQEGLSRRAYHLPHAQARLDQWWRVPGLGVVLVGGGVICIAIGLALRRRARRRSHSAPDDH